MKIAIIGSNKIDSMESHLTDAFNHIGHQAKIFDIYESFIFVNRKTRPVAMAVDKFFRTYRDSYDTKRFQTLVPRINEFNPELVICLYKDIHPSLITKLKLPSRKVVHLNPDQLSTLGYQQIFAADYDAWFTKDNYMLNFMSKNMHLKVFPYREAFNPRFNPKPAFDKKEEEKEVDIDVATYGTLYPYRTRMLSHIIDAGVNIKLFGVIPHRFFNKKVADYSTGKYIVGEEKAKILYGSKIVLNNLHFAEVESVNCRFFEINGCGGFQLCDYRPILKDLLPIDPELVSYKSVDEAIEKIKYYLKHSEDRYVIADKIYNHYMNNYTYDHLARYILEQISNL